jgi:hypothetical protein
MATSEGEGQSSGAGPEAGEAKEVWPSFETSAARGGSRAGTGIRGRGRRPRFMQVGVGGSGDGCGDPNCGGMC